MIKRPRAAMPFLRRFARFIQVSAVLSGAFVGSALGQTDDGAILTIADIGTAGAELKLDMADLEALERESFFTTTIWTNGLLLFDGVPLSEILVLTGTTDGSLLLKASNDYAVEIPVEEVEPDYPIIAYRVNGVPMSLRDKGPLWLVYPYDSSPRYQTETIYTRSIWQLVRIEILP